MLNSFGRPATDIWLLAPVLWSMWLAMTGRWWWCGAVLGVGVMLKGQVLLGVPIALACGISTLQPAIVIRWLSGFLFAVATVGLPWLLTTWSEIKQARVLHHGVGWMVLVSVGLGIAWWLKYQ